LVVAGFNQSRRKDVPHTTAFQRADRLALLTAIEGFHKLLAGTGCSEEAIKLGFLIRRYEYQGRPADMSTLASELGWKENKVSRHFKELETTWGFWKEEDKRDSRRKIARIPHIEHQITTAFYDDCLKIVDRLVLAREEARQQPESDPWSRVKTRVVGMGKIAVCLLPALGGAFLDGCFYSPGKQAPSALIADNDDDDDKDKDDDPHADHVVDSERVRLTLLPRRLPAQNRDVAAVVHLRPVKRAS
jgi:hypothetical protein